MLEFVIIGIILTVIAILFGCYLMRLKYLGFKEQGFRKISYSKTKTCSNEVCPVCLEDFRKSEELLVLFNCQHGFHPLCLRKWLKLKMSCPMCKSTVGKTSEETSLI